MTYWFELCRNTGHRWGCLCPAESLLPHPPMPQIVRAERRHGRHAAGPPSHRENPRPLVRAGARMRCKRFENPVSRRNRPQSRCRDQSHPPAPLHSGLRPDARAPTPEEESLAASSRKRRRPCSSRRPRHASSIRVGPNCMPASSSEPAFLTLANVLLQPSLIVAGVSSRFAPRSQRRIVPRVSALVPKVSIPSSGRPTLTGSS